MEALALMKILKVQRQVAQCQQKTLPMSIDNTATSNQQHADRAPRSPSLLHAADGEATAHAPLAISNDNRATSNQQNEALVPRSPSVLDAVDREATTRTDTPLPINSDDRATIGLRNTLTTRNAGT